MDLSKAAPSGMMHAYMMPKKQQFQTDTSQYSSKNFDQLSFDPRAENDTLGTMLSGLSQMRKVSKKLGAIGFFVATVWLLGVSSQTSAQEIRSEIDTPRRAHINVMAPLGQIQNWDAFRAQLRTLKNAGVSAITTDIWWGHFEAQGDNIFDWAYYTTYAQVVAQSGLKWIPILSFHQCGGNVGDDCNIPLPSWIWSLGREDEMKFRNEKGFVNGEYVSHFFEPIHTQYAEAMSSFAENFAAFQSIIPKVYLSLGPAGELRYPSYYGPAGWSYPDRGSFQAYGPSGRRDFRNFAYNRYKGDLNALNEAWRSQLTSFAQVNFPTDGDRFFADGVKTVYGHDFLSWYQGRLIQHLRIMTQLARTHISPSMPSLKLGAKIAGIHWLYNSPNQPHAAEFTAGYYNYEDIIFEMKELDVELTFTCLEMDNADKWIAPYYSAPRDLVTHVSTIAQRLGVPLNGENALAISNNPSRYDNIGHVLRQFPYTGFTLLRMQNIVDYWGRPTAEMWPFQDRILRPFSSTWVHGIKPNPRHR
jgi:beta-amylase